MLGRWQGELVHAHCTISLDQRQNLGVLPLGHFWKQAPKDRVLATQVLALHGEVILAQRRELLVQIEQYGVSVLAVQTRRAPHDRLGGGNQLADIARDVGLLNSTVPSKCKYEVVERANEAITL